MAEIPENGCLLWLKFLKNVVAMAESPKTLKTVVAIAEILNKGGCYGRNSFKKIVAMAEIPNLRSD